MRTFVFGDMHGRHDSLAKLLEAAGVIDADGNRTDPATEVISIGDLLNVTMMDTALDEEMIKVADRWVDTWILGNHEAPLLWPHIAFRGFSMNPVLRTHVNRGVMNGRIVPCLEIGNTLLTHAGVVKDYDFKTAEAAADAIYDVWYRYSHYSMVAAGGFTTYVGHFDFGTHGMPKGALLDAVGRERGGSVPDGGILWADWEEPKNTNFSQIVGHTPLKEGPVRIDNENGTFTLNIDSAVKKGLPPSGVWLDENGEVLEIVTPEIKIHTGDPTIDLFGPIKEEDWEEIPGVREENG